MKIRLYNTLTRKKEVFKSRKLRKAEMYVCGLTVYNYAHIGNLRAYINADILRRVLEFNGYKVHEVMNITDVGHLISDADTGADKLEKAAKEAGKNAWAIAKFYTREFKQDLKKLNIEMPQTMPKATKHIKEMIELIQSLETKGYTYKTSDGIYFDSSKFKKYGEMARLDIKGLKEGIRIEKNQEKKNPTDFALWKFSYPDGRSFDFAQDDDASRRQMEWESPWGIGFPGWHIECSAMSMRYFGPSFDIHTGGVDHISVHHTNEIAQSEAATGKKFVNYWIHSEFLLINSEKMAKSKDNFYRLKDLEDKGFSAMDYRFFILTSHYRTKLDFTFEKLEKAKKELEGIRKKINSLKSEPIEDDDKKELILVLNNDLDTSGLISMLQKKNNKNLWLMFDKILGLGLNQKGDLNKSETKLLKARELARKNQDFKKSDEIRDQLNKLGVEVEDTKNGQKCTKTK